jgi:hypothetical protein
LGYRSNGSKTGERKDYPNASSGVTDCKVIPHRLHGFEIYLRYTTVLG